MRRSGDDEESKRIIMDLDVLLKCHDCDNIVQCYGYLIKDAEVWIFMELMVTCLDKLLRKLKKPFPEKICGKVAVAVRCLFSKTFVTIFDLLLIFNSFSECQGAQLPERQPLRHTSRCQAIQHPHQW